MCVRSKFSWRISLPHPPSKKVICIIKDDDGYETCLVGSEFFDKATREATDWKDPDWEKRAKIMGK